MKTARAIPAVAAAIRRGARRALSLVEIMVVIVLLSVIILGLVAMFDQTRRAFTGGLNQVDVLEAGRTAMDLIVRDVRQMMPAFQTNGADNFYANVAPGYTPIIQPLTDPNESRTNTMEAVYFVTRSNLQWSAIGYKVDSDPSVMAAGVGTLYRYSAPVTNFFVNQGFNFSQAQLDTNYSRVIDGVVSFRCRVYDWRGLQIFGRNQNYTALANLGEYQYRFWNDAVPAYVEVELAILESRALDRWRGLTNNPDKTQAQTYLKKHAGQVHVFRQRVSVRAVSPDAFK